MYFLLRRLLETLLGLPPGQSACRFLPTCHEYCHVSIKKHGWLQGIPLCLWRLLRCHPFSKGGYDPIP